MIYNKINGISKLYEKAINTKNAAEQKRIRTEIDRLIKSSYKNETQSSLEY